MTLPERGEVQIANTQTCLTFRSRPYGRSGLHIGFPHANLHRFCLSASTCHWDSRCEKMIMALPIGAHLQIGIKVSEIKGSWQASDAL